MNFENKKPLRLLRQAANPRYVRPL